MLCCVGLGWVGLGLGWVGLGLGWFAVWLVWGWVGLRHGLIWGWIGLGLGLGFGLGLGLVGILRWYGVGHAVLPPVFRFCPLAHASAPSHLL